jgi:hypothetical protein
MQVTRHPVLQPAERYFGPSGGWNARLEIGSSARTPPSTPQPLIFGYLMITRP